MPATPELPAVALRRPIGVVPPARPRRAGRIFRGKTNMLTNPLTGKKKTTLSRPKSRLSSPLLFFRLVPRQVRQSGSQDLASESLEP